jgi:PST family polysaccharide transporter
MDNENREGFADRTFAALKWNYGGAVVRAVSQLAILVVLTRLLGPQPFGLVAVAWLVVGFGNLVADFGFGAALVQRRTISGSEIRYAFTMQVLIGACLTMIVAGSAGLIGRILDNPEVVPVIRSRWCFSCSHSVRRPPIC